MHGDRIQIATSLWLHTTKHVDTIITCEKRTGPVHKPAVGGTQSVNMHMAVIERCFFINHYSHSHHSTLRVYSEEPVDGAIHEN